VLAVAASLTKARTKDADGRQDLEAGVGPEGQPRARDSIELDQVRSSGLGGECGGVGPLGPKDEGDEDTVV
jgi:hypothetical protein